MFERFNDLSAREWLVILSDALLYVIRKWYLCLLAAVFAAGVAYIMKPKVMASYSATYSFVLSTETRTAGNLASFASQFGVEMGAGSTDNIFSGDNIIELFRSRKMVTRTLMLPVAASDPRTLLTVIVTRLFPEIGRSALPFPASTEQFNPAQKNAFEKAVKFVMESCVVYKKDKKLIFYLITTEAADPEVAYFTSRNMLEQTAAFFIQTKTKVASRSMELLLHEADSLGNLLGSMYRSAADLADRSFNINPSILAQRSGVQLTQAKSVALSAAYAEVLKNLEIAKINVQKETPLYQVIDEPVLPLQALLPEGKRRMTYAAAIGVLLMVLLLMAQRIFGASWTVFSKR